MLEFSLGPLKDNSPTLFIGVLEPKECTVRI
jgi:hypothetical protein